MAKERLNCCPHCGDAFTKKSPRQRYCTPECAWGAQLNKMRYNRATEDKKNADSFRYVVQTLNIDTIERARTLADTPDIPAQARDRGELLYEAEFWNIPVVAVPVYEWRMGVFGSARRRAQAKDMAMEKARTICGSQINEHEAEAICIALYAAQQERLRGDRRIGA